MVAAEEVLAGWPPLAEGPVVPPDADVEELVYEEGGEADEASLVEGGGVGHEDAPAWGPYPLGSIDIQ